MMRKLVRRWLRWLSRAHLLHFLLLGLVLWWAVTGGEATKRTLVIQAGDVEQTAHEWAQLQGHPVTRQQHRAIVEQLAREQLLVRLARSAGFGKSQAVRERLLLLGRFLGLTPATAADQEVIAAVRQLGLDRSDAVVRRYLEASARSMIAQSVAIDPPDDAEIAAWYNGHAEQFTSPTEIAFSHVFIKGTGADSRARAQALLDRISSRKMSPSAAVRLGDAFLGGNRVALQTRRRIAATMGEHFARVVSALVVGRWSQPVASAYGWHLVYIERVVASREQPLSVVRAQVVAALDRRRRDAVVARRLDDMRRHYNVVVIGAVRG